MDIQKEIDFIDKKQVDSEHYFPDWHKEYLAKVLIEYHKEQLTLTEVVASLKDKQAITFEEYTKSEGYTEISYELYKKGNRYCNKNSLFTEYKKKHDL